MEKDTTKKTTNKPVEDEELDPAFYADPKPSEVIGSEMARKHGGIPSWAIALIIIVVGLPILSAIVSFLFSIIQFGIGSSFLY